LAMATIVSVARVAVGTHYPSDVIAGALIGTLAALFFWLPPIRTRLHALADWVGHTYERLLRSALGNRGPASTAPS
jgi:undecaprenyl-diphosphatase